MDALDRLFAECWNKFLAGVGIDPDELEDALAVTGLAEHRAATQADLDQYESAEFELGDQLLCLTDEGRSVMQKIKAAERREKEQT